jgi:hypothetical protein
VIQIRTRYYFLQLQKAALPFKMENFLGIQDIEEYFPKVSKLINISITLAIIVVYSLI